MKTTTLMIKEIKKECAKKEFQKKYAISENDFVRNRKMTFVDVIMFVLCNLRTVLSTEIFNFCMKTQLDEVSPAAMSKAKSKIKYEAFEELLNVSNSCISKERKYKGYQVLAVDGMKGELPKTKEFMDKNNNKENLYPTFHSVATYDVLNNYYLNGIFEVGTVNERQFARKLLAKTVSTEKQIYLYDRGFPEVALIQQLNQRNKYYVMRVSKSFLREVNQFYKEKCVDKTVHISYSRRRGQTNEVKNAELPYEFDLRMVRIKLKSGQTEVLITNLPREEFKKHHLNELYNLRWGIESSFNELKNAVVVEEFLSKKENTIKQEFYSALILYNLTMCFVYDTKSIKQVKKNGKIKI